MNMLTISILIFCVVAVSSKPWGIYVNGKWVPGCSFFDDQSFHNIRWYPLEPTTLASKPFPERAVQSHPLQNEVQNNNEDKIIEKIEDVRNEIDDNAEDNIPPPEKIILTNEDIMNKLENHLNRSLKHT